MVRHRLFEISVRIMILMGCPMVVMSKIYKQANTELKTWCFPIQTIINTNMQLFKVPSAIAII